MMNNREQPSVGYELDFNIFVAMGWKKGGWLSGLCHPTDDKAVSTNTDELPELSADDGTAVEYILPWLIGHWWYPVMMMIETNLWYVDVMNKFGFVGPHANGSSLALALCNLVLELTKGEPNE